MGSFKNLIGLNFGKLTVISQASNKNKKVYWNCICTCGKEVTVSRNNLCQGHTKSCGCINQPSNEEYEMKKKEDLKNWYKINEKNQCWEWTGFKYNFGYGLASFHGKKILSHRLSWILYKGNIPNGLCILHKCDNRKCINPVHLFLGSKKDNTKDMLKKKRHKYITKIGEAHGMAKLNENEINEIRKKYKLGISREKLIEEYKISKSQIRRIITNESWKHLHDPE